jgi:hypothetical protein
MKAASRSSIAGVGTVPGQIALQVMSCLDQGSDLARLGEVGAVIEHAHAVGVHELLALALDLGAIAQTVHHDIAAVGGETLRHRVAQALRRAGDERASALQHKILPHAVRYPAVNAERRHRRHGSGGRIRCARRNTPPRQQRWGGVGVLGRLCAFTGARESH